MTTRFMSLAIGLVIWSTICITIQAQSVPGFLSVDCGSSTANNDTSSSILWESDDKYIFTGTNAILPDTIKFDKISENVQALKTFRYFPVPRSKHCYDLPLTTSNVTFLLRAMFLLGSPSILNIPISFDVTVNGTIWSTVKYGIYATADILNTPVVIEGLFHSPGSLTYVCLRPDSGVPFISSLELRQLDQDGMMYIDGLKYNTQGSYWLSNLMRYNCGAAPGTSSVRYPDDPFDRIWHVPGDWANSMQGLTNSTDKPSLTSSSKDNNVPPKVMQDAWLSDTANSSFQLSVPSLGTRGIIYVAAYTEEIQPIYPSGSRYFKSLINGYILEYDMEPTNEPSLHYTTLSLTLDDGLNFTFITYKSSLLGPIVNAIEAYDINIFDNSTTAAQDVHALADMQANFNLTDWQGDPCNPVPWDWVACIMTDFSEAKVTKLLLSGKGINGFIPPSISQLDGLTEVHLDNNSLHGTIPDSLATLENLTLLLLNDNNLSGEVPPDLASKLGSNFSYAGNSLLGLVSPTDAPSRLPGSSPSGLVPSTTKKSSINIGVIIAAVACGGLGVGAVLSILLWYKSRRRRPQVPDNQNISQVVKPSPVVGYVPYEVVRSATGDFKEKIGQGSYGSVYHGWLNNREVAVKLNSIQSDQGLVEFMNEVDILTRVHHRNLVSLIGYCNEGKELILIYEYQVNGTLREWLHDETKPRDSLDWAKRLEIAADGAKGLEYLHKGCKPTIIHRDVKSSNILLDDTLTAKVADFGLSKTTPCENSLGLTTNVKGTPGYLDPEYHNLGRLTHKSDVYSYGVVLAEIITGRPPFIFKSPLGGPSFVLLEWLRKLVERNEIRALADPNLEGKFNPESMWRMAETVLACVNPVSGSRPDFTQVVQCINEAIALASPNISGNTLYVDSSRTAARDSPVVEASCYFSVRGTHSYRNLQS